MARRFINEVPAPVGEPGVRDAGLERIVGRRPNLFQPGATPLAITARRVAAAIIAIVAVLYCAPAAHACPFCTALVPSLSQSRAGADVTALVEVLNQDDKRLTTCTVHQVLDGQGRLAPGKEYRLPLDLAAKPGALLLVFGTGDRAAAPDNLNWHAAAVNETSYAYFAQAPSTRKPTVERLRYFARFLEHADPLVAEDAYLEFGHAGFAEVSQVAELLPAARVRQWLASDRVPPHRKGFYGLVLGLATAPADCETNRAFLRKAIETPDDDFRSGFDGILGGYLLLAGEPGLEWIERRYLADSQAADGDVRHAMTALRFYHEFGREIPPRRIAQAMRHLLARPEFAEAAITDLARWQDWEPRAQIAGLYANGAFHQPPIRRAIIGYLTACPEASAAASLATLRQVDPQGVKDAEAVLSRTTSVKKE